jgi:hypothetical protein
MADIRTLKLALLADTKDFIQGLDKADNEARSFSDKLGSALKTGALAFAALGAAAGAAAVTIGVQAVKAAIEDEKAQAGLAKALENTTGATKEQIKAVEEVIDAQARATGVADDELRPSLQRLLVSTKDIAEAQKLQALALDISAGSGKSLAEVSEILAKASDGNYKALKTLGVELKTSTTSTKSLTVGKKDLAKQELASEGAALRLTSAQEKLNKTIAKNGADSIEAQKAQNAFEKAQLSASNASDKYSKTLDNQGKKIKVTKEVAVDFDNIVKQLTDSFGGQAEVAAGTFAGRMARVKVAIDEAKESIGAALLPILEKLLSLITDKALPFLNKFVEGFQNVTKSVDIDLGGALQYLQKIFTPIFNGIKSAFDTISSAIDRNREKLQPLFDLFKALADFTKNILIPILAIGLGEAFKIIGQIIGGIIDIIALMVDAIAKSIQTIQNFINKIQEAINKANSIPVVGAFIPDSLTSKSKPSVVINNNIKGAIDPQATARAIVKVQTTATKTTGIKPFIPGR